MLPNPQEHFIRSEHFIFVQCFAEDFHQFSSELWSKFNNIISLDTVRKVNIHEMLNLLPVSWEIRVEIEKR